MPRRVGKRQRRHAAPRPQDHPEDRLFHALRRQEGINGRLQLELWQTQLRAHQAEGQARALRAELDGLRASSFWRITRPLRWLVFRSIWLRQRFSSWRSERQPERQRIRHSLEHAHRVSVDPERFRRPPRPAAWAEATAPLGAVDIIIPVHNGHDHLPAFLHSLHRHTPDGVRYLVVDDASTDARVSELLRQHFAGRADAVLLHNPRNLGFPGSVNRAVALARGDFILLNTDITLPPDWLPRLLAPLAADATVASVTPMTNAGTLLSWPRPLVDNPLPDGLDAHTIDAAFATEPPVDVDLPTAVGFCMAVRRAAVTQCGFFDADAFGRGYGEENDWSMRTLAAGWRHVAASNLFVYHHHGGSFAAADKERLLAENVARVCNRHPAYLDLVAEHVHADPLAETRWLAFTKLLPPAAQQPLPPLLILDHGYGGGANAWRHQQARAAMSGGRVVHVVREGEAPDPHGKRPPDPEAWLETWYRGTGSTRRLTGGLPVLEAFCEEAGIGEILYNDGVGWREAARLPRFLLNQKARGRPYTVALHDYFPICPVYTLLDDGGHFCGIPESVERCHTCLSRNPVEIPTRSGRILEWRTNWGRALTGAREVIAFSESSARLLRRAYPDLDMALSIRPHRVARHGRPLRPRHGHGLRLAVVGGINHQKGLRIVQEMGWLIKREGLPMTLSVVGIVNTPWMPNNVRVLGAYRPENLATILRTHGINMVLFPSIWPETFSFVVSEVMALNLPIVCFDLGAPAERISRYSEGRIIPRVSARSTIDTVLQFHRQLAATPGKAHSPTQPDLFGP